MSRAINSDWPLPVRLLAERLDWDALSGGTLVVACSGGPDSVALARAAHTLLSDLSWRQQLSQPPALMLWHLDHGLREESADDAEFVQRLGEQLLVPVIVERAELRAELDKQGGNLEALARHERYSRMAALAAEQGTGAELSGPVHFMTAHHLGDQAETVLHHIVRGTHLTGLRGISRVLDGFIHRPWLELAPEAIREYLHQLDQGFVTDATNTDTTLTRSRIRHDVMPVLRELNPRAREHLARLASVAVHAQLVLTEQQEDVQLRRSSSSALSARLPLLALPAGEFALLTVHPDDLSPSASVALAAAVATIVGSLDYEMHEHLMQWARSRGGQVHVRGWTASFRAKNVVALEGPVQPAPPLRLVLEPRIELPTLHATVLPAKPGDWERYGQYRRTSPRRDWDSLIEYGSEEHGTWLCFLPTNTRLPLTLRSWRRGERISLAGGGSKTLGDLFTDCRVPACFREVWAIVADCDDEVVCVPGLADGAALQLGAGQDPSHILLIHARSSAAPA